MIAEDVRHCPLVEEDVLENLRSIVDVVICCLRCSHHAYDIKKNRELFVYVRGSAKPLLQTRKLAETASVSAFMWSLF